MRVLLSDMSRRVAGIWFIWFFWFAWFRVIVVLVLLLVGVLPTWPYSTN